ncbi:MAG TPA: hypothetical protein VFX16_17050 [Pseudonocardiaceae bacterium]|nr:hypothetical protein [Pseudonocardiaceae bacterium]
MDGGYLWTSSAPNHYIVASEGTGQFYDYGTQQATGYYYLNANWFAKSALDYGEEFWLIPDSNGKYNVQNYSGSEPSDGDSLYVPWEHIAQHTYKYINDFNIKEAHTFWPYGTTEEMLLGHLVKALNENGATSVGAARVAWDGDHALKTFFLNAPVNAYDRYSVDQMSDLFDLFS